VGAFTGLSGSRVKRGEIWWADLGAYRLREQTGRRPVVIWQSDHLTRVLQSVLVVPLTTNLDRANLAGAALISAAPDGGLPEDSRAGVSDASHSQVVFAGKDREPERE